MKILSKLKLFFTPTDELDAVNKKYVDELVSSISSTNKKISELEQTEDFSTSDLMVIETENGTRSINYYDLIGSNINTQINNLKKSFPLFNNNAISHNCIFRGKYLGNFDFNDVSTFSPSQHYLEMIRDGSFKDLYIGDYFYVDIESLGLLKRLKCTIAGFNIYYNPSVNYGMYESYNGNNVEFVNKNNHAVIVAEYVDKRHINYSIEPGGISHFRFTNLYQELYDNSDEYPEGHYLNNNISSKLQSVFNGHILKHRTSLPCTYDSTSKSYYFNPLNAYIDLLSETQVFGTSVFSHPDYEYTNTQLPLFALDPTAKIIKDSGNILNGEVPGYWLRNTYGKDSFVYVTNEGIMDTADYTGEFGICPFFCIG